MRWFLLIGRLLFGGVFLFLAARHAAGMDSLAAAAAAHGVPYPELAVGVSALLLALGGASVVLGFMPRIGLGLIALYLVPVTGILHAFWTAPDASSRALELALFTKNLALLGASAALLAVPTPWPWSVDEWLSNTQRRTGGGGFQAWLLQLLAAIREAGSSTRRSLSDAVSRWRPQGDETVALARARERDVAAPTFGSGATYWERRSISASPDGSYVVQRVHGYWMMPGD